jgi:hypothetical protein
MIDHSVQEAFDEFRMRANMLSEDGAADIGAVLTDAVIDRNILLAQIWGTKHLPGGINSATDSDWWFLSFSNCIQLGVLNIDPTYLTKEFRIKAFKEFSVSVPATVYKMIYVNDESYIQQLNPEQRAVLAQIGGQRGFKRFVDFKPKEQSNA